MVRPNKCFNSLQGVPQLTKLCMDKCFDVAYFLRNRRYKKVCLHKVHACVCPALSLADPGGKHNLFLLNLQ